jgi:hypothetical protein
VQPRLIERSKGCGVETGDVAALLALELIASLAAYNRAPLAVILAATRPARRWCAKPTGSGSGRRH